jgi:DNA-binding GntR family transcriptional regulator
MDDDALIARWQRSGRRDESIAADIATRIRTGKYQQYSELPPRTGLAREFDVSESTVTSAKRLLAAAKILAKGPSGIYTVA